MVADIYNWVQAIPIWMILLLLFFFLTAMLLRRPHAQHIQLPLPQLFTVHTNTSTNIGIISGIIGTVIGIIQIGAFFSWWPESLGAEPEHPAFTSDQVSRIIELCTGVLPPEARDEMRPQSLRDLENIDKEIYALYLDCIGNVLKR